MKRREFLKATGGLVAAAALPPVAAASAPSEVRNTGLSAEVWSNRLVDWLDQESSWATVEDLVGYAADGEIRVRKMEDGTWFAAITPGSTRTS